MPGAGAAKRRAAAGVWRVGEAVRLGVRRKLSMPVYFKDLLQKEAVQISSVYYLWLQLLLLKPFLPLKVMPKENQNDL